MSEIQVTRTIKWVYSVDTSVLNITVNRAKKIEEDTELVDVLELIKYDLDNVTMEVRTSTTSK